MSPTSTHFIQAQIGLRRPYDIEADWILMSTCNYRCAYCFWDEQALGARISPPASVERLASFFNESGLIWLLHLTGGEPFLYPDFVQLCQLLTDRHRISVNTNADSPRVRTFAERLDPKRVDFINCGVHLEQRAIRHRAERFIENFSTLKASGFDVFASCVMYPNVFTEFAATFAWYAERGVVLIPKALQGHHRGRTYPDGYTDAERIAFTTYTNVAATAYEEQFGRRAEPPTINPFMDGELFMDGLPDHRGQHCLAGQRFVRIRENGDIRRCGPTDTIGNIVEGWFDRRQGPSLCQELECPYFCEKYRLATKDSSEVDQCTTKN